MIIEKRSGKPFKNKLKFAEVIGSGIHPVTGKPTYILADNSHIEVRMVKKVDDSFYGCLRRLHDHLKPECSK